MTYSAEERWGYGSPWRRSGWESPFPFRYLMVGVVALIQLGGTSAAAQHNGQLAMMNPVAYSLLVASAAALLLSRRFPVGALAISLGATLAYWLLYYPIGPIFLAPGIAYVSTIVRGRREWAWVLAAAAYAGFIFGPLLVGDRDHTSVAGALGGAAWLLAGTVAIEMIRTRREKALVAVRHRREESRRRASEERLDIARELHDVLAHNISLINVQAGVALHLMEEKPEQARIALSAIKEASHGALEEVRAVLNALRSEGEAVPRSPASTLDRLDDLVAVMAGAGIALDCERTGDVRPLPPRIDLAAYRIIQEALTNVARHSEASRASVRVDYGSEELAIDVTDNGKGAPSASGEGNGIPGMRERASILGGSLQAENLSTGGFRVRARIPLPPQT